MWIDLSKRDGDLIEQLASAVSLPEPLGRDLGSSHERAELRRFDGFVRLTLVTVADIGNGHALRRVGLDIIAGPNLIATIHDGPSQVVDDAFEQLRGETRLGALDAGSMLAILVDVGLSGYFLQIEEIERAIDGLDELVLGGEREGMRVLQRLAAMRHRLSIVRRTLAPHRQAFSPFGRPDFELHAELGRPWPGLIDRFDHAMVAVENAWVLLVGSFDIYIGRAAQRSNDVMKVLTLLSAVLLPSVVLAGIFGMNFKLAIFERAENIWLIVGSMAALAVAILVAARRRGWL